MLGLINYILPTSSSFNPVAFVFVVTGLLAAITIHEFAHAYVADRLGDPTARINGRVTLNPLAHLDPIGTIAMLIASIGWGKPVPFDPYNLENPKRDSMLISLAGPLSNFALAIILAIVIRIITSAGIFSGFWPQVISDLLSSMVILNIGLGVFNLVPIPPLDGSKILAGFLPRLQAIEWEEFSSRYGFFLLLLLLMPIGGGSLISQIIYPVIDFLATLLLS